MLAGEQLTTEKLEEYVNNTGRIAAAVESLTRHEGWEIFLTLYAKQKRDIKNKSDYRKLENFRADRKALKIVDDILATFEGYAQDALDAAALMKTLSDDPPKDRGIMLIDVLEGDTLEG